MRGISQNFLKVAADTRAAWCILRKFEEIELGIENDIDVFIARSDYHLFVCCIISKLATLGIVVFRRREQPCGVSLVFHRETRNEFLKVDIVFDNTLLFFSIIPPETILRNIDRSGPYPLLRVEISAEVSVRKERIRRSIWEYITRPTPLAKRIQRMPTRIYLFSALRAFFSNTRRRSGALIVLAGPDGSGKTTIGDGITQQGKRQFFAASFYHFSINLFPRLQRLRGKQVKGPDYTLADSGTSAPIQPTWRSVIYTLYYGLELLLGTNSILRRHLRMGRLCVFDRYFHDYFFQRSYRNAPRWLVRLFLQFTPRPDLVVYCHGDPGLIYARKPELSPQEILTQQGLIESQLLPFWRQRMVPVLLVDTTIHSLEEVTQQIFDRLATEYAAPV